MTEIIFPYLEGCNECPFAQTVIKDIESKNPGARTIALSCGVFDRKAEISAMIEVDKAMITIGPSTGTTPEFCPQLKK